MEGLELVLGCKLALDAQTGVGHLLAALVADLFLEDSSLSEWDMWYFFCRYMATLAFLPSLLSPPFLVAKFSSTSLISVSMLAFLCLVMSVSVMYKLTNSSTSSSAAPFSSNYFMCA